MRWKTLFQDLELELHGLHKQQETSEVREQICTQSAEITIADRLRGSIDSQVEITTVGGHTVEGVVTRCYSQWLLLREIRGEALVPLHAVVAVSGLTSQIAAPAGPSASRLTLAHALRGLARDRSSVQVETTGGQFWGMFGTIGRDWAQMRLLRPGEVRATSAAHAPAAARSEVTLTHEAMCVVLNRS